MLSVVTSERWNTLYADVSRALNGSSHSADVDAFTQGVVYFPVGVLLDSEKL